MSFSTCHFCVTRHIKEEKKKRKEKKSKRARAHTHIHICGIRIMGGVLVLSLSNISRSLLRTYIYVKEGLFTKVSILPVVNSDHFPLLITRDIDEAVVSRRGKYSDMKLIGP